MSVMWQSHVLIFTFRGSPELLTYTLGMLFWSSVPRLLLRARLGTWLFVCLYDPRDRTLARLVRDFTLARTALQNNKIKVKIVDQRDWQITPNKFIILNIEYQYVWPGIGYMDQLMPFSNSLQKWFDNPISYLFISTIIWDNITKITGG